jgi:DNA modification methylase
MRYVKTVRLKHQMRPAQYFYSLHLVPFRRVTSNRINIEGIIYNLWSFPPIKKRDYLAAFPLEKIDHFILLEYTDPVQYLSLSSKKV